MSENFGTNEPWTCTCGTQNTGKFCISCGKPRLVGSAQPSPTSWRCECGTENTGKFCITCGKPRPGQGAPASPDNRPGAAGTPGTPAPVTPPPASPMPEMQPPKPAKKETNPALLAVGITLAVFLIGGGIAAGVYYGMGGFGPKTEKTETTQPTASDTAKPAENTEEKKADPEPAKTEQKMAPGSPITYEDLKLGDTEVGVGPDVLKQKNGNPISQKSADKGATYFKYGHIEANVKNGVADMIATSDTSLSTPRGIHQGSTLQDVTTAYGPNYMKTDYQDLILYEYNASSRDGHAAILRFAVKKSDNTVSYIAIRFAS